MGGTDCEFVDGFHPGEVADARILVALSGTPLGQYLDRAQLSHVLETRAGRASMDERYARPGEAEVDFLKLGCRKNGQ